MAPNKALQQTGHAIDGSSGFGGLLPREPAAELGR
jgi:hypothetical protein